MRPADALYAFARKTAMKKAGTIARGPAPHIPDGERIELGDPMHGRFWVGFAARDITPADYKTPPYWMAGYGIAKRITGFLDPLTASAMWIGCGDGPGIVLINCDLIGMTGYEIKEIRESLSGFCRKSGCVNVTVSCTHTHAGVDTMGYWGVLPKSGKDKAYMKRLKETLQALCEEAWRDRRPGALYYGNTEAPELLHRWRAPYFSKALHRFRFVPEDGGRETWYLNFPAHPNTLGGKNKLLSADYPCYMRREIDRHKKTNVLYAVSAIGATDIGEVAENDLERTILGGMLLGKKACEIENERQLAPMLTVVQQFFVMPLDNIVLSLANALGVFNARSCPADSETGTGFISELDYFDIGGARILTVPGEMFPELVWPGGYEPAETSAAGVGPEINPTPLAEILGDEKLMVFGVTNDMAGYALAPNDFVLDPRMPFLNRGKDRFGRSHYHETNSCGVNTAKTVAQTCERIKRILDES